MKSLVGLVWFLDTAHAVILFCGIYQCLVNDFGRVIPLDVARVMGEMPPRVIVAIIVQGFCFWRIWKLYRSVIPVGIYIAMTSLQIAFTIVYMMATFEAVEASRIVLYITISGYGYMAAILVADLTMAGMLTALLYKEYRRTSIQSTSEMIRRLSYFSVNTGTWTAVYAILAILLSTTLGDAYYWVGGIFDIGVCGVYSNTLLANLNGRDYIVGDPSVTISFYRSTDMETRRRSGLRAQLGESGRSQHSKTVEEASVFEAAKRSQISVLVAIKQVNFLSCDHPPGIRCVGDGLDLPASGLRLRSTLLRDLFMLSGLKPNPVLMSCRCY